LNRDTEYNNGENDNVQDAKEALGGSTKSAQFGGNHSVRQ